ncbi:MAG: Hsp20/alpha crystallin family protein [Acidobacteriota bacterium]
MLSLMPVRRSRFLPDRIDRIFEDPFFRIFEDWPTRTQEWVPPVEVVETDKEYRFMVEVPGMEEKDLTIQVDNGVLTFSGEKRAPEYEGAETVRSERWYGKFTRSFSLPESADPERIEAHLKHGILTITVPKRAEAQPRKVEVKVS